MRWSFNDTRVYKSTQKRELILIMLFDQQKNVTKISLSFISIVYSIERYDEWDIFMTNVLFFLVLLWKIHYLCWKVMFPHKNRHHHRNTNFYFHFVHFFFFFVLKIRFRTIGTWFSSDIFFICTYFYCENMRIVSLL